MTPNDSDTDVRRELLEYLEYQRASVRSIVEGLNEDVWHTPIVASGWTVAGMVEHLGGAERHWFQEVVAGVRGAWSCRCRELGRFPEQRRVSPDRGQRRCDSRCG